MPHPDATCTSASNTPNPPPPTPHTLRWACAQTYAHINSYLKCTNSSTARETVISRLIVPNGVSSFRTAWKRVACVSVFGMYSTLNLAVGCNGACSDPSLCSKREMQQAITLIFYLHVRIETRNTPACDASCSRQQCCYTHRIPFSLYCQTLVLPPLNNTPFEETYNNYE